MLVIGGACGKRLKLCCTARHAETIGMPTAKVIGIEVAKVVAKGSESFRLCFAFLNDNDSHECRIL